MPNTLLDPSDPGNKTKPEPSWEEGQQNGGGRSWEMVCTQTGGGEDRCEERIQADRIEATCERSLESNHLVSSPALSTYWPNDLGKVPILVCASCFLFFPKWGR